MLIGTDPEFFVVNKGGKVISAISILEKHPKEKKKQLSSNTQIFYDNIQLEMNISPANSSDRLVNNIRKAINETFESIYPNTIVAKSQHDFSLDQLMHEDSMVFGCEPEFCAYEMKQICPPFVEKGNGFRTAGGHIHIGDDKGTYPLRASEDLLSPEKAIPIVKLIRMLDIFLGIPSVIMDNDSTSKTRRTMYGKAGSHRIKPYGCEYRPQGNFWLRSPRYSYIVFNLVSYTVNLVKDNEFMKKFIDSELNNLYDWQSVVTCINTQDKKLARKIYENLISKYMPSEYTREIAFLSEMTVSSNLLNEWSR